MTPAGIPISRAVQVSRAADAAAVRHALRSIDRVHGDGDLPVVPVSVDDLITGAAAEYRFFAGSHRPQGIRVNRRAVAQELAFVHEVGHLLDHLALGARHDRFASEVLDPELRELRTSLLRSEALRLLRRLKLDPTSAPDVPQPYLTYLLSDEEVFARAYAQWVASRSDDATLQEQVAERCRRPASGVFIPLQWDDDDFEPIGQAFGQLFERRGWRQ